ncbi:MAG: HAD-IIIA family hydrolase, partial [Gammaproteobacteria bacterium]|nr:HAD-IIIA family hydrolase [Gammaproteobacteria bacterium]
MNHQKYIILDRDGVINIDSPSYIKSAEEWNAIPNSLEAIKKLTEHEYHIIIISNQSGLGRG